MSKTQSRDLDQFYTDPKYANIFFNTVQKYLDLSNFDLLLEPSAGSGSFYNLMDEHRRIGLDLDPKATGIVQQDFFTWRPEINNHVFTLGNPPFGKNANLAVKFFNHAATFSDAIAFVLPRTFRKASIINRLNKNFHLIYDEDVPANSFIFDDQPYDVWCCAQIWIKRDEIRSSVPILNFSMVKEWFEIVEPELSNFSVQRVGAGAGTIRVDDRKNFSSQSNYFIKQHSPLTIDIFKTINFDTVKFNTAGNPSISASELVELWVNASKNYGIEVDTTSSKKKKKKKKQKPTVIDNPAIFGIG